MLEVILDAVTKVTQFLTASAAFVLVIVAGPRELRKWRRLKYEDRKAEVAAAALVVAMDLLDAMELATTPVALKGDLVQEKNQSYYDFMRGWFSKRLDGIKPQLDALQKQRSLAHVYLTEQQNKALADISGHVNQVAGDLITWTTLSEGGPAYREQAIASFQAAFGEAPRKTRERLRTAVTDVLRASAQFKG